MRRADREITEFSEIVEVLERCDTIRLGLNGEKCPYVVPLSFGYEVREGKIVIFVHGAEVGLKHDMIEKDNRVCAEADICHGFAEVKQGITTVYESVIGFGTVEKAVAAEAIKGLDLILSHCGFGGHAYDTSVVSRLTVYKITLETVTGKRNRV